MHSERSGVVDDAATDRPEGRAARTGARTVASRVDGMKVLAGALGQLPRDGALLGRQRGRRARRSRCAGRAHPRRAGDRALPARAQPARARARVGVGRARRRRRSRARARSAPARQRPLARARWVVRGSRPPPLRVAGPRALRRPPIPRVRGRARRAAALAAPRPRVGAPSLRRLEPLLPAPARAEPRLLVRVLRERARTRSRPRRSASSS